MEDCDEQPTYANENNLCSLETLYSCDVFRCGQCSAELCSIDDYVSHMILEEQCMLVLAPSSTLHNVLLPRFKKPVDNKIYADAVMESDTRKMDVASTLCSHKIGCSSNELDLSQVIEIETGENTRLKCKLCGLTFSREAAFLNHHKLQHSMSEDSAEYATPSENLITDLKNEIIPKSEKLLKQTEKKSKSVKDSVVFKSKSPLGNIELKPLVWEEPNCHQCGQIFKNMKTLKNHVAIVHSDVYPFICNFDGCGLSFKLKGSFIRHKRRHTGDRPYKCPDCGRVFRESGSLTRHKQSKIPCVNKCDVQFPRYGITQPIKDAPEMKPSLNHFNEKESNSEILESTVNEDVEKIAEESKANVMSQILKMRKSQVEKIVKQEEKTSQMSTSKSLNKEKIKFNKDNINCKLEPMNDDVQVAMDVDECLEMKADIKVNSFQYSQEDVPSILRKSFVCPVCHKNLKSKSSLDKHIKCHLGQIGLSCDICNKIFNCDQAVIRHLTTHSNIRQFECCICYKSFKLLSTAKNHLKSHSSDKNFLCSECGHYFKSVSSRNLHMKIHKDEKAFRCDHCDKAFITKGSLQRHVRVHTGETPFHCPYCRQGFKEHGTLRRHLLNKFPCSQQEKLKIKGLGIPLAFPTFDSKQIADLKEMIENDSTFDENESDIFSEARSPTSSSIPEEVNSPLISSNFSYHENIGSKCSFDDDDFVNQIDANLLSHAIASLSDEGPSSYDSTSSVDHPKCSQINDNLPMNKIDPSEVKNSKENPYFLLDSFII